MTVLRECSVNSKYLYSDSTDRFSVEMKALMIVFDGFLRLKWMDGLVDIGLYLDEDLWAEGPCVSVVSNKKLIRVSYKFCEAIWKVRIRKRMDNFVFLGGFIFPVLIFRIDM